MKFYKVTTPAGSRLYQADSEQHAHEQHADCFSETVQSITFTHEYSCPECGHGCYTIADNRDAPIPNPPTTVHDDEGRHVVFCPVCDTELTPEALRGEARG